MKTFNITTHTHSYIRLQILIYLGFLSGILSNCGLYIVGASENKRQTFLMANKTNELFLRRYKRYLVFEKGSSLTFQSNIAKSIIPPAPRGLNVIAEYTLSYELPTDFHFYQKTRLKTTQRPASAVTTTSLYNFYEHHKIVPYDHDYYYKIHPEYLNEQVVRRKYSYFIKNVQQRRCLRRNFYDYNRKLPNICLRRSKRNEVLNIRELTVSQRMFYDLIEKWSLLHGFLPRYCFMRTLCESSDLLLPYGYSLLHDIIHILLRYTKPWAFHHKIFGRSLWHHHSLDECAKLYGPHCRVSLLDFITNAVHGSRAVDLMR